MAKQKYVTIVIKNMKKLITLIGVVRLTSLSIAGICGGVVGRKTLMMKDARCRSISQIWMMI